MNTEMIRKATIEDINDLLRLQKIWESEDITLGFKAATKEQITESLKEIVFVYIKSNYIIGFISGRIKKAKDIVIFEDDEEYLDIEDLYIEPSFRSSGIGKKLFNSLEKYINESGVRKILIYSSTKDINKVISFYNTCGMKSWCIQMYK